MREIKFRAWDTKSKTWLIYWTQGQMVENKNDEVIVQQFTGLKDKNGKEIYEGDIITDDAGELVYDEVIFNKGCFCIKKGENLYHIFNEKNVKVIGNIFENPELINK